MRPDELVALFYKRAVQLEPTNADAVERLTKLGEREGKK